MAAVERTNTDGTANSSTSLSLHTSSMLLVNCSSAGIFMPGRLGCTRVVERLSTSASMADQTCTSFPLTQSIRASAMPQVPAPRTPIFRFVTFISSESAAAFAPLAYSPQIWRELVSFYCTRNSRQRQLLARLHKVSACFPALLVITGELPKQIASAGNSCYSFLVGIIGFHLTSSAF